MTRGHALAARAALITAALLVLVLACERVPDVRFEDEDAGAVDGASDEAGEAGAGDEVPAQGCPAAPPDNADGCCGATPCVGRSCTTFCSNKCSDCAATGSYCCTEQGGSCVAPGAPCK